MDLLSGPERRNQLLKTLQREAGCLTGQHLSDTFGVSRQVVVQDIAILRAEGHPILATPRGYLYWIQTPGISKAVLAVCHDPEQVGQELFTLVDHSVTVINVMVDHPLYGELVGNLNLKTRNDVEQFLQTVNAKAVALLSSLTGGVHLHMVEGHAGDIAEAKQELDQLGILLGG